MASCASGRYTRPIAPIFGGGFIVSPARVCTVDVCVRSSSFPATSPPRKKSSAGPRAGWLSRMLSSLESCHSSSSAGPSAKTVNLMRPSTSTISSMVFGRHTPCVLAHRHSRLGDIDHRDFWRENRRVLGRVERTFDHHSCACQPLASAPWASLQRIHRRAQPTIGAKPVHTKGFKSGVPEHRRKFSERLLFPRVKASACCSLVSRSESIFVPTIGAKPTHAKRL